jgi:hypothetical protein
MRTGTGQLDSNQPGDPPKLAQALLQLAASGHPPVHLPLGSDSMAHYRQKTVALQKEIHDWQDVTSSTDFAAGTDAAK